MPIESNYLARGLSMSTQVVFVLFLIKKLELGKGHIWDIEKTKNLVGGGNHGSWV